MEKLTIVWQRPRTEVWEDDWIEYLFRNIPHDTIEDLNHNTYLDNSVIVESIWWAPHHSKYISELHSRNYKFGLIHLSDERCCDDISSYTHCKFVMRNYYRGNLGKNVIHFPLGWNSGFTSVTTNPSAANRQHTWSFVGHRWDANRNVMAAAMITVPNNNIYVAEHHGPRLNASDMSKIYRNSIFVPCPRGAIHIDNFRVTEALEAGCIPIVERNDYWTTMYGTDIPILQIDSWNDVPALIANLLTDIDNLDKLRLKCYNWWVNHKNKTVSEVTTLVTQTME